jgi:hypothetical protein
MILKGSQRGGAKQLAMHLLNERDNDHVEVHSINGFIANDLNGALTEIYAVSRATKCRQFMFSLSLSPPKEAAVTIDDFEAAITQAAEKLGLDRQPRVVLFHEKEGRRHCHVVFSRIDLDKLKAINLSFYKNQLREVSRELFLTHGWDMPEGLKDRTMADPANFTLEQWQMAKRHNQDPREIKRMFRECWSRSDNRPAFISALKDHGFWLARGDRRSFVAIDYKGTIYSLSRWSGMKPKDLKARLGDPGACPSVEQVQTTIDVTLSATAQRLTAEVEADHIQKMRPLMYQRQRIIERQRQERRKLAEQQKASTEQMALEHAAQIRRGIKGLWDWLIGNRRQVERYFQLRMEDFQSGNEAERQILRGRHLKERRILQKNISAQRGVLNAKLRSLYKLEIFYNNSKNHQENSRRNTEFAIEQQYQLDR